MATADQSELWSRARCWRRARPRRWAGLGRWRWPLAETEDLEDLIRPYLVRHASVLAVPRDAAGAVAVTWVLPSSACVGLNSPVMPEPLTVWIKILIGLYRNPIGSRSNTEGIRQTDYEVRRVPVYGRFMN